MPLPSLSWVIGLVFSFYISHSIWTMSRLFTTLECSNPGLDCYQSYLARKPNLQLVLFTSVSDKPTSDKVTKIETIHNFNYEEDLYRALKIDIPRQTRKNGTLFLYVILASDDSELNWTQLNRDGPTIIKRISLTDYIEPKFSTYNLLGNEDTVVSKKSVIKRVSHIKPKIYVSILTDLVTMTQDDIPPELARYIRINRHFEFLPILQNNFLKTRIDDLVEITKNTTEFTVEFFYSPIGIGKLRLLLQFEYAMSSLLQLGLSTKDIDEVKGIFSDTNVYLLCGTVFVGSIHILFDFLSFKNDITFWKRKSTYVGVSLRTTLWRGFSQIIIFLYLLDERTSLLVIVPCGIGTIIELWKCKKILKLDLSKFIGGRKSTDEKRNLLDAPDEQQTKDFDKEAMTYLSYLLYPLIIGGSIYSLLYQPHKSWYSWALNTMVNGVYAFGFLFMLPQLFVNYKLKSVAALPFRAFMYKAFNTFIDDIFAFIITMPTSHRVACFRDDVVFAIYLYQRWLYPVDTNRLDDGHEISELKEERKVNVAKKDSKKNK